MQTTEPSSRRNSKSSNGTATSQNTPQTFDEFLKQNRLTDWPEPLTSEGPLDIQGNNLGFGQLDDIHDELQRAAPVDYGALDDLVGRLQDIESLLFKYADTMVARPEAEKLVMSESMEQTFLTETGEGQRQELVRRKPKHQESMSDIKKRSVDYYQYPGFVTTELNELPSQLEAPQVLNEVTKAQDFNSGFKKFWQKIFLSEASVAVMQDLFWYIFIDKFDKDHKADQAKLFDRIADSFVALFFSINPEIKDKFFQVYPNCLAQAVFVAYNSAFPESSKKFDDKFIDDLVNTCVEWVTGIKPVPESWRSWDIHKLVRSKQKSQGEKRTEVKKQSTAAAFHGGTTMSLDMDGFQRIVNRLGHDRNSSVVSYTKVAPSRSPNASKLSFNNDGSLSARAAGKYSHQIGPGPEFETVSFDTLGQSLLVTHFLTQRKLQADERPRLKVKRTQVAKLPPQAQTYQEIIDERTAKAEILSRQYQQAVTENEEEINRIQRKNARMNREMNKLARQVVFNKNPVEIKIMSERVLDLRERQLAPTVNVGKDTAEEEDDDSSVVQPEASNHSKLKITITE